MSEQSTQWPPALKHGVYSGMTLLPGEDPAAFEKLHAGLIAEYNPSGCHEESLVENLAHLIWRKQNLPTYQLAKIVKTKVDEIFSQELDAMKPASDRPRRRAELKVPVEELRAALNTAVERTKNEVGSAARELSDLGEVGTLEYLLQELAIHDRLDGMIDRVLKRLLFIRGLKSIASASSAQAPASLPPAKKLPERVSPRSHKTPKLRRAQYAVR